MDDNMFELMTKMYDEMKQGFANVDQEFAKVRQEIKQEGARLENQLGDKIDALFDGYKQNAENISIIKNKIEKIEKTIDGKSIIVPESDYVLLKKAE